MAGRTTKRKRGAWTSLASFAGEGFIRGTPVVHHNRVLWMWPRDPDRDAPSIRYDAVADRWISLATEPLGWRGVREGAVVVSCGDQLVVWGGAPRPNLRLRPKAARRDGFRVSRDGAWTPMASKGAPAGRSFALKAWTGTELLIWGGHQKGSLRDGTAYRPDLDQWRPLATNGAPAARTTGEHVWCGDELLLWGGNAQVGSWRKLKLFRDGFAYDPADDRWRALADVPGRPEDEIAHRATVRCGADVLFVRGTSRGPGTRRAWRYEVARDRWVAAAPPPEGAPFVKPQLLDCDGRVVLCLGTSLAEYLPARDVWRPLPALPALEAPVVCWVGGAIHAFATFGHHAGARLTLPKA